MKTFKALSSMFPPLGRMVNTVLAVTALVLVAYFVGTCGKRAPDQNVEAYQQWKAIATQTLAENAVITKQVDSLKKQSDSLQTANQTYQQEAARLNAVVAAQRVKNNKKLAHLEKTLPDTCKEALELAKSYRDEADSTQKIVAVKDSIIENKEKSIVLLEKSVFELKRDNANLVKTITVVPVPKPDNKFLGFIPKPSRKTSFVVGAAIGAVGSAVVYNAIK